MNLNHHSTILYVNTIPAQMKNQTMASSMVPSLPCSIILFAFLSLSIPPSQSLSNEQPETFIVHVSAQLEKPSVFDSHHDWYHSALESLPPSSHPQEILYTYTNAMNGFAASLTPSQASHLRTLPGIVSVLRDGINQLHTTHSPSFLGLSTTSGAWKETNYGEDVIIGVLDSGIWPERLSFNSSTLGPVPGRWKGVCETGPDFPNASCNRKIIGARTFYEGHKALVANKIGLSAEVISPRDNIGHGSHVASIAAGSVVENAGFYEYAVGKAQGMATRARIAVYKVCWSTGCADSDILAGFEQAIADKVDVISISVGAGPKPYDQDAIAVGAFGAMEKGIIVSASAGNAGPKLATVNNAAPWILTVGASTINREFRADVVLGDGRVIRGVSLYSGDPPKFEIELVYAGDAGSQYCEEGKLNSAAVTGKIVVCDAGLIYGVTKGISVKAAGGIGMILVDFQQYGDELRAESYLIPATLVSTNDRAKIIEYIKSQSKPTAALQFQGTVIGSSPSAPKLAAISSRGPNAVTPHIIKPDVIAPGINILAAWTGATGPTHSDIDKRRVEFGVESGTSMACPHVSGLAAMVLKAHPSWSPAAIKSALMTTAYDVDNAGRYITDVATGKFSTPFQHGSGHVEPNRALDPGLVYDNVPSDYEAFFCSIGYDAKQISVFVKDKKVDCASIELSSPGDLNYPSFSVIFQAGFDTVKHKRVVKNVGSSVDAVYNVKIRSRIPSVRITVSPTKLVFSAGKTSLPYEIAFESRLTVVDGAKEAFGSIEWSNGVHVVKSPIAFLWNVTSTGSVSSV